MASVSQILDALEAIAPARYAFGFDRVGLQVGDPGAAVVKAVVSLDRSLGAVDFATARSAQLLLSHHPLIFSPIGEVTPSSHVGSAVFRLIARGIAHVAAHTNWDCAKGGVNDALAARLGLRNVVPFGGAAESESLKLAVTAPAADVDAIVDAAASAGAGEIGAYRRCAFLAEGTGTFLAGDGASPAVGTKGEVERAPEVRIEMVLPSGSRFAVEQAIRRAHSYEEPAIDFFALTPGAGMPIGRVGDLEAPKALNDVANLIDGALGTRSTSWGRADRSVRRIAVVGGAADGEWEAALHAGADLYVTGEVKQHVALEAVESGIAMIAAGHYATEQPGCAALRDRMAREVPDVEWLLFEPLPGEAGRPL